MAVNKVVYNSKTLIDLTKDTVTAETLKKGYTAHKSNGIIVTGVFEGTDLDEVDRILTAGLTDGYKHFSDDGTIISTTDSEGRILTKTFSGDFLTCTTVLRNPSGVELGRTVKSFQNNSSTITTTDSKGQKLVKSFTSDLKKCTAVLTGSSGAEIARLTKTFSDDGKQIESVVVYK